MRLRPYHEIAKTRCRGARSGYREEAFTAVCSRYPTLEEALNAFYEHHQDSISFHYRCFDRTVVEI
jgi:hypothetical protein